MVRFSVVTLLDVARAAGVSRSTASNVFAHPSRVNPKLRQKIEETAQRLGYLGPDPRGRFLRQGQVNAIGIVPPGAWGVADSLRNPVYHQFLSGVAESCDLKGFSLVIIPDRLGNGGIGSALVDGLIFGRIEHIAETKPAQLRRLPFVVMDVDAGPAISSVSVDAHAGGYEAARHLIDLGHRHFAIMSFHRSQREAILHAPGIERSAESSGMETDQEKYRGFADGLRESGIEIRNVPMVQAGPWDARAAGLLLDASPHATAVFSMSIMQGIAVLKEAQRRGLHVPRDLSVVGFNDILEAALCDPPLTTVDSCTAEKGRIAAEIVLTGMQGERRVLKPQLIIRRSTGMAPSR